MSAREVTIEAAAKLACADCGAPATRMYERTPGHVKAICGDCHHGSWYATEFGPHIVDGEFQSDKYPTTPRGKVPLSVKDATAQDLLWSYAQRRRAVDAAFAGDLEIALKIAGYVPHAEDDAITFTADEREELGKIAHASAPHASPWDTMFAVAKEAYRVQGEAVGRRAIALVRERDRNVVG